MKNCDERRLTERYKTLVKKQRLTPFRRGE